MTLLKVLPSPLPSLLRFTNLSDPHITSTLSSPLSGQLAEGKCLRVTGPNGSGKTTLLKLLAGINPPQNGYVEAQPLFYCGHKTGLKLTWSVRQNLAFRLRVYTDHNSFDLNPSRHSEEAPPLLCHHEEPFPLLSSRGAVGDVVISCHSDTVERDCHVTSFLAMTRNFIHKRYSSEISINLKEILAKFKLTKYLDAPLGNLSRGQQQQIALISGLLSPYKLWILDEPFAHLDQHAQTEWQQLMINHCQQGGAIVYSTHNDQIILKDSLKIDLSC